MNELRWILLGIGLVLLVLIYLFSRRSARDDEAASTRYEPALTADGSDAVAHAPDGEAELAASSLDEYADSDEAGDGVLSPSGSGRFDPMPRSDASSGAASSGLDPKQLDKTMPFGAGSSLPPRRVKDANESKPPSASSTQRIDPEPAAESTSTPIVPEKVIALRLVPLASPAFDGIAFVGAVQAEGLKFGRFDIFHRFSEPEEATDSTPSQFSLANMIKPGTFSLHDLDQQQFKGATMFLVLPGPEDAVAAFADMVATGRRLAATLNGQLQDAQGTPLSRQSASHLREDIINYQHGLSAAPAE